MVLISQQNDSTLLRLSDHQEFETHIRTKKSRTSDPEPTLASTSVDQDHNLPGSDLSAESGNVNQDYQEEKQNVAGAWTDAPAAQYSVRRLLEFIHHRIETCGEDLILKNHFESATSRKKYISPSIQNETIKCCGDEIINTIVQKVTASKYYSIVSDKTTDLSKISQISIVIRYLDEYCNIREIFLVFWTVIKKLMMVYLSPLVLTLSDQKGAVSAVQETLNNAVECPCYNHCLNLSISKSSNIQDIRNAVGTIKETIAFLMHHIKETKFLNTIFALELISKWKELKSSSKAQRPVNTLTTTKFIISLFSLAHILSLTENLSRILQQKSIDKSKAQLLINDIKSALSNKREKVEACFKTIFNEAECLHKKMNIPLISSRICARQQHWFNIDTEKPEDYFRISTFIPLLDDIPQDLNFLFNSDLFKALEADNLLPSFIITKTDTEIEILA
nr:unnamed protein product [Callosobruchus analis]